MQLTVINSNSAGNAYILSNDREALLIECGVAFTKIKEALNFDLKKVVGCILTHEHGDHAKSVKDVLMAGINVYATDGTHHALNTYKSHRAITTFSGDQFKIGGFTIAPFDVEHDVAEPVLFLIHHEECGKILFLTDSYYCKWQFNGLNNIIIEANYDQRILDQRLKDGATLESLRDRVITSHMSLKTCKGLLAANDLSAVQKIVLIHLSDGNSNAAQFKLEVEQQTGKPVYIAEPGLKIPFNKTPF